MEGKIKILNPWLQESITVLLLTSLGTRFSVQHLLTVAKVQHGRKTDSPGTLRIPTSEAVMYQLPDNKTDICLPLSITPQA